jgi:general secretion pathway protein M
VSIILTPFQARGLAVALLLLLFAGGVMAIAVTVQRLNLHYDSFTEDRLDKAARYLRVVASRPLIEAQLAEIRALDSKRHYLFNSSPALAAAEIQNSVQASVESLTLKLESTVILPHSDMAFARKVTVNFKMRGKLSDIQKLLYNQSVEVPFRYLDNLSISSGAVGGAFVPTPGVELEVLASFDVYGYAFIDAPVLNKPVRNQSGLNQPGLNQSALASRAQLP